MLAYWSAIDAAVHFNVNKHIEFSVVEKYNFYMKNKTTAATKQPFKPNKSFGYEDRRVGDRYGFHGQCHNQEDEIQKFFRRHRNEGASTARFQGHPRFALPKLC